MASVYLQEDKYSMSEANDTTGVVCFFCLLVYMYMHVHPMHVPNY